MKVLFKKAFAILVSMLMTALSATFYFSASAATFISGDTNADGAVDLNDAINICKHLLKKPPLSGENLIRADCNKDGVVNLLDAVFIARLILSKQRINDVVVLVNQIRKSYGADPLILDNELVNASMKRSSELMKKWSSIERPDRSDYRTVLAEYDIDFDNSETCICAGAPTAYDFYSNMKKDNNVKMKLTGDFTKIGVGYCTSNDKYKHYWAIILIK